MPTRVHKKFIKKVVEDVELQLASIAKRQSTSVSFAQNIEADGSTTISFGY
jgi:hypothetical protein